MYHAMNVECMYKKDNPSSVSEYTPEILMEDFAAYTRDANTPRKYSTEFKHSDIYRLLQPALQRLNLLSCTSFPKPQGQGPGVPFMQRVPCLFMSARFLCS